MKRLAIVTLAALAALAGCSSYNDKRGKGDAPVGDRDDTPAALVFFPDGFMNVAHKCYGPNGIYVHTRVAAPTIVVNDPQCGGVG